MIAAEGITAEHLEGIMAAPQRELQRRDKAYYDGRPPVEIKAKTVIVVDDGLATGATMNAALQGIRTLRPSRLVVAVPAAPADVCQGLRRQADEVICATRGAVLRRRRSVRRFRADH